MPKGTKVHSTGRKLARGAETVNKGVDQGQHGYRGGIRQNGIGPLSAPMAKDKIDKYKGKYPGPTANNGIGPVKIG
jgi:hypothetical protein